MTKTLSDEDIKIIGEVMQEFPGVRKVIHFGGEITGNYSDSTEIDLAVSGRNITEELAGRISDILNDDPSLSWTFDVVDFNSLKDFGLADHVLEYGRVIYLKNTPKKE